MGFEYWFVAGGLFLTLRCLMNKLLNSNISREAHLPLRRSDFGLQSPSLA
jgi:hypothetical protein